MTNVEYKSCCVLPKNSFQVREKWSNVYSSDQKCEKRNNSKKVKNIKAWSSEVNFTKCPKVPEYVRVLLVTDMNGKRKQLHIPAALDLDRPKRPRTTFTEKQLEVLEKEFQDNHFLSEEKRQELSQFLNLSQTQIRVWYQNRRTKYRRAGVESSASTGPTTTTTTAATTASSPFPLFAEFKLPLPFRSDQMQTREKLDFPTSFNFSSTSVPIISQTSIWSTSSLHSQFEKTGVLPLSSAFYR